MCLSLDMAQLAKCYHYGGDIDHAIHLNRRSIEIFQINMPMSSRHLSYGECHCHTVPQLLVISTKEAVATCVQ